MRSHAGSGGSYFVAGDELVVVRWISAFNSNIVGSVGWTLVITEESLTIAQGDVAPQVASQLELRIVVPGLLTITASSDPAIDLTVSGYLLTAS